MQLIGELELHADNYVSVSCSLRSHLCSSRADAPGKGMEDNCVLTVQIEFNSRFPPRALIGDQMWSRTRLPVCGPRACHSWILSISFALETRASQATEGSITFCARFKRHVRIPRAALGAARALVHGRCLISIALHLAMRSPSRPAYLFTILLVWCGCKPHRPRRLTQSFTFPARPAM